MYKGVLFDLDGTLADTVESIAAAGNKVLGVLGFPSLPVENYKYYAGNGADILIRRVLEAAGDNECLHFKRAYEVYKEFFKTDCTYKVQPYDGIVSMLEKLKERGIKMGVVSNKPHQRSVEVVESLFGKGYFDTVTGQKEGVPKKPDPASTLAAAREMGLGPETCIYVGDTDVDMQTGNRAGMFTVGVLWGFRKREELERNNAHKLIEKPGELLNIF